MAEGEGGDVGGRAGFAHPAALVWVEGDVVVADGDAVWGWRLLGVKGAVGADGEVFAGNGDGGGDLGEDEAFVLDGRHLGGRMLVLSLFFSFLRWYGVCLHSASSLVIWYLGQPYSR